MVDFKKQLGTKQIRKHIDPVALYETLDRASDKGPLRPAQYAILHTWHNSRRNERDVILKLHTGQGKTLIGLLILQSKLNELAEPAIYLCPDNYLVEQTCDQAKQFGIKYCTIEDGDLPDEFCDGKSILVTSVQKLFNGRSKFKLGPYSMPVSYILMDDAHACIVAIRSAFRLRLEKSSIGYQRLLDLFSDALNFQGAGTFSDIRKGDPGSLLPIPYWEWNRKHLEVLKILKDDLDASSGGAQKPSNWFVWPLLKDMLQYCQCVVAGHALEIEPYLSPLDVFGSFFNAKHRVFMSATVTNDAFLVKGLRLARETIENPLTYEKERWSGEKMILIPSLIHDSLHRQAILQDLAVVRKGRKSGLVVLFPSFQGAKEWEDHGARIAKRESIAGEIEQLRRGQCDAALVIVNRYDGIDLPDRTCRVLVFDSMPYSESLIDRYEESCRASSQITLTRVARTIEQGLGRSVRGEKDYCVIVLIGNELVKFVRREASRRQLSSQTQTQIEIGLVIAELAKEEIRKGTKSLQAFHDLMNQCLNRDEGWKDFYVEHMENVTSKPSADEVLKIFAMELDAELSFADGNPAKAAETIQLLIDEHIKDPRDKSWYLQEMARFSFVASETRSAELQVAAHRGYRYLMKPRSGIAFSKLNAISQKRVEAINNWVRLRGDYSQLSVEIDDMLATLQFGKNHDSFEEAFKDLGIALGFSSERPDKETNEGPDNLWCVESGRYLLVECKNEVDTKRTEISKTETGQMNNSCAWFEKHYPGVSSNNVIIIPANKLGNGANFAYEVGVMRETELRKLRNRVKAFFSEFSNLDFSSLSSDRTQKFLDAHELTVNMIFTEYVIEPK